jgi:hypothetical protein
MTRTALTTLPAEAHHVLSPWVGQRSATFRFELINGLTGALLGEITPIRGASLTHDTSRTIKRSLTLDLGKADTAAINPITDRVDVFMVFNQEAPHEHPLGRYMFVDSTRSLFTSGRLSNTALTDEMFILDQAILAGIGGRNRSVTTVITSVIQDAGTGAGFTLEASPYSTIQSWGIGINRGQVLEALALSGDFFSPWFGNDKQMHFVRSFDPAKRVPDFDFDVGNQVIREPIIETDDLLLAPNRFIVISNAPTDTTIAAVGTADVVATAPHSIQNRGFVIAQVIDLQVSDSVQAGAVALNLANRQTVFQRVSLSTVPDPRHDSYNVIRWQGQLWLELAWSMSLIEGGQMNHLLRKAYR